MTTPVEYSCLLSPCPYSGTVMRDISLYHDFSSLTALLLPNLGSLFQHIYSQCFAGLWGHSLYLSFSHYANRTMRDVYLYIGFRLYLEVLQEVHIFARGAHIFLDNLNFISTRDSLQTFVNNLDKLDCNDPSNLSW